MPQAVRSAVSAPMGIDESDPKEEWWEDFPQAGALEAAWSSGKTSRNQQEGVQRCVEIGPDYKDKYRQGCQRTPSASYNSSAARRETSKLKREWGKTLRASLFRVVF